MSNFNPPAPCGAGRTARTAPMVKQTFQSTRPVRGGTTSYPRKPQPCDFNPPAPCGAGRQIRAPPASHQDFNPPAPCGAGLTTSRLYQHLLNISIHPPRAGRDGRLHAPHQSPTDFNPPAPCGAGHNCTLNICQARRFQSTRPVRGGTISSTALRTSTSISIHPPRAGRDIHNAAKIGLKLEFQSTRPVRGGTSYRYHDHPPGKYFNPPAPCGAGQLQLCKLRGQLDFNPPAPCGAGPHLTAIGGRILQFQSTRPVRGGTWKCGAEP